MTISCPEQDPLCNNSPRLIINQKGLWGWVSKSSLLGCSCQMGTAASGPLSVGPGMAVGPAMGSLAWGLLCPCSSSMLFFRLSQQTWHFSTLPHTFSDTNRCNMHLHYHCSSDKKFPFDAKDPPNPCLPFSFPIAKQSLSMQTGFPLD